MNTKMLETIEDGALEEVSGGCFLAFGVACAVGFEAAQAAWAKAAAHGCGGASASPVASLFGGCAAPSAPSAPSPASASSSGCAS